MGRFIQIVEVGPRDGLQNEKAVLEPAVRADLVRRLEQAGAKRIEAVSFVHPKYVPRRSWPPCLTRRAAAVSASC
jgi:hydroxymethylglutaryl-CoA lyase